jgi:hypothetical protein
MPCKILVLLSVLFFASCITNPVSSQLQPYVSCLKSYPSGLPCPKDSTQEWERAQVWLARHSQWKIQIATNALLQTYNPPSNHYIPSYSFMITKEPYGTNQNIIKIAMQCSNMFGGDPKPEDIEKAFYYYVESGVDILHGLGIRNLGAIN